MSRNLDRSQWGESVCEELTPVIKLSMERYGIQILGVTYDLKGMSTEVYLDGDIPRQALEVMEKDFSSNPLVEFDDPWISCTRHCCSIRLARQRGDKSVLAKLAGHVMKIFKRR